MDKKSIMKKTKYEIIEEEFKKALIYIQNNEKELAKRKSEFKPIAHKYKTGVLAKYSKLVGSASKGAVCD